MSLGYHGLSLWHDTLEESLAPRPALPGDVEADVAIVGAGYTGLWTAYWLTRLQPDLRIVIVEKEIAGFGASGRNGGWCSALFPTSLTRIAREGGREGAIALQRAMNATVLRMGETLAEEGIDAGYQRGGYLSIARNPAQLERARREIDKWRSWGFGADHIDWLSAEEMRERVRMTDVLGGTFASHCAVVHPARLVRGLAEVVERRGAAIYEDTAAVELAPGRVVTDRGTVRAPVVVRATEGYTATLAGMRRDLIPMYSLMVATEPLPDEVWEEIGLAERSTFADMRHLRIYGQRTADGRFAFGGRGAPYHYGSRVRTEFDEDRRVHDMLERILRSLFPVLEDHRFSHRWGGNLGIPRDWFPSVGFDRRSGLATAGGYVGDGVATSEVAGLTLAQLITGEDTELTRLPWVNRVSRRWEPEPLRWTGVNAVTALFASADITERRTGRPARSVPLFWRALGH